MRPVQATNVAALGPFARPFVDGTARAASLSSAMQETSHPKFSARCRTCSRVMPAEVAPTGDAETAELRAHAQRCLLGASPSAFAKAGDDDLGTLLARSVRIIKHRSRTVGCVPAVSSPWAIGRFGTIASIWRSPRRSVPRHWTMPPDSWQRSHRHWGGRSDEGDPVGTASP